VGPPYLFAPGDKAGDREGSRSSLRRGQVWRFPRPPPATSAAGGWGNPGASVSACR
jgi:hypothetical protein